MATVEETKPDSAAEEKDKKKVKEGHNLLGSPTFKELENGRFKCIETGHELPAKDMGSYGQSKRCRLGLIDSALSLQKPPLNMFKQDPLCRSKLKCKLTGDTINKSEEHIWKHINGRRFLHKLEQKEEEKLASCDTVLVESKQLSHKVSKSDMNGVETDLENNAGLDDSRPRRSSDNENDLEETDFWIPPVGSRWDNDDGGDRWGTDSEQESEEGIKVDGVDGSGTESGELSQRTKRISIEVGPSSFASRKKKSKINS
ncbi:surfeit locus protein 2-like [Telopea speciosissima]|uniref:surfeit locus protein 2-like n=1 Tax=Telopea speciosissima TaxID=54955 RepID=UPI001CC6731B|nr:surfeit locus protein 2-like [Telopea speciosissima]